MYDKLVKRLREDAEDGYLIYTRTGDDIADAADAIEELLQKMQQLPRWIPVTERLPSYGDWVLGIGPKKGYYVCEYRGVTHWRRDGCDPWFSAKGSSVTVTHWMPLPEPPKEET